MPFIVVASANPPPSSLMLEKEGIVVAPHLLLAVAPPLQLTLPKDPNCANLVGMVRTGMLAELRKAVHQQVKDNSDNISGKQSSTKRRRIGVVDPVVIVTQRLCSDLVVSSKFYQSTMQCVPVAFDLIDTTNNAAADDLSLLNSTSGREAFIKSFAIAMNKKYGGNSIEHYVSSLDGIEFVA